MTFDATELNLIQIAQKYSDEDKARTLLESLRWPSGPVCPHCSATRFYTLKPKADSKSPGRKGLYKCAACRKQYSVTVGTVFEASHIPLSKWLMAVFLICSSKKAMSAHQLHRMLGITYKTAWFMAHRIRYAMSEGPMAALLSGVVEVDETYVGGKPRHANNGDGETHYSKKTPVVTLVERDGKKHSIVMERVNGQNIRQAVAKHVCPKSNVMTDESALYSPLMHIPGDQHRAVNHSKKEYFRKEPDFDVHTNTVESTFPF